VTASAAVTLNALATVEAGASLTVAAAGSFQAQAALVIMGTVSSATAIAVTAPTVTFSGTAAVATNAMFSLGASSEIFFQAGSVTVWNGTSSIAGTGSVRVGGIVHVRGALNVATNFTVQSGGDIRIKEGVTATFATFNMVAGASASFAVSASASARATVSGAAHVAGNIIVNVASEPAAVVVLVQATGGISGTATFTVTAGVSAGRRLLAQGTVVQNANSIEYHPGSGSASNGPCFLALGAVSILMWF
jgi:hypothetical protein